MDILAEAGAFIEKKKGCSENNWGRDLTPYPLDIILTTFGSTLQLNMKEFIETICILDGAPQHLHWHQERINTTFRFCRPHVSPFDLETSLLEYDLPAEGKYKCTLKYNESIEDVFYALYHAPKIVRLQLKEIPEGYDYRFKYADRQVIEGLYAEKGDADDILMTRAGWITDTSIANIAFRKENRWYTPAQPLLAGTTLKRLITEGLLISRPIHQSDLIQFDGFKLFNTMNDWEEAKESDPGKIYFH